MSGQKQPNGWTVVMPFECALGVACSGEVEGNGPGLGPWDARRLLVANLSVGFSYGR
jgi:hypothetical protein